MSSPSQPEEYINLQQLSRINNNNDQSNSRYASPGGAKHPFDVHNKSFLSEEDFLKNSSNNRNSPPNYLYLQDGGKGLDSNLDDDFDDHNYYEAIRYDSAYQETSSKPKARALIVIIAILIIILIISSATLGGVILLKKSAKSRLQSDPQFCTSEPDEAHTLACRRSFVRNMTSSAFNAYRRYSWGGPELKPVSLQSFKKKDVGNYPGLTIVDSMSTLWIMDLKEEWDAGREWISSQMPPFSELNAMFDIKEMFLDVLGGLLSAYALSGDSVFLERATEVGETLSTAFVNSTGMLPYRFVPKKAEEGRGVSRVRRDDEPLQMMNSTSLSTTQSSTNQTNSTIKYGYSRTTASDQKASKINFIAYIGFQQPELIYLANLTGDQQMTDRLEKSRSLMESIEKYRGLYMSRVDITSGSAFKWNSTWASLMDISTGFFYNMINSHVQLNGRDSDILEMYGLAMDAALASNLFSIIDGQLLTRVFDVSTHLHSDFMYDNSCLLGGMFALSSEIFRKNNSTVRAKTYLQLAVNLTDTCHFVATGTKTKLLPYQFWRHKIFINGTWLRSYLAETYFLLHRVTREEKYREWAWELVTAIYNHCRVATSGGFANVKDVNTVPTDKSSYDNQPAEFLSGTLKYLYLIFTEPESVLPLEKWFFNSRGHPLPICGSSDRYPAKMCDPV